MDSLRKNSFPQPILTVDWLFLRQPICSLGPASFVWASVVPGLPQSTQWTGWTRLVFAVASPLRLVARRTTSTQGIVLCPARLQLCSARWLISDASRVFPGPVR